MVIKHMIHVHPMPQHTALPVHPSKVIDPIIWTTIEWRNHPEPVITDPQTLLPCKAAMTRALLQIILRFTVDLIHRLDTCMDTIRQECLRMDTSILRLGPIMRAHAPNFQLVVITTRSRGAVDTMETGATLTNNSGVEHGFLGLIREVAGGTFVLNKLVATNLQP